MMKDMPRNIKPDLLAKFLSGEADTEEVNLVLEWLDTSDENKEQFSQYEKVWSLSASNNRPTFNKELAWKKVNKKITKPRLPMPIVYSSVAAAVIAFTVLLTQFSPQHSGVYEEAIFASSSLNQTIKTALPDGSEIMLFPQSEITYQLDKTTNTRTAQLQGDAFFKVKKDSTQRFVVHTPYGGVEVLGTQFNVDVQANNDVLVDVLSGRVKLFLPQSNGDTLFLIITNKESAIISKQTNTISKCTQQASAFYQVNETLTFNNVDIRVVFSELENCYDATIEVDSTVARDLKLTASFKNDSIDNVLMIITETLNLNFSKNDGNYLIKANDE